MKTILIKGAFFLTTFVSCAQFQNKESLVKELSHALGSNKLASVKSILKNDRNSGLAIVKLHIGKEGLLETFQILYSDSNVVVSPLRQALISYRGHNKLEHEYTVILPIVIGYLDLDKNGKDELAKTKTLAIQKVVEMRDEFKRKKSFLVADPMFIWGFRHEIR